MYELCIINDTNNNKSIKYINYITLCFITHVKIINYNIKINTNFKITKITIFAHKLFCKLLIKLKYKNKIVI